MRRSLALIFIVGVATVGIATQAGATALPHLTIESVKASKTTLSNSGGSFTIRAKVAGARSCQLVVTNDPDVTFHITKRAGMCLGGTYATNIRISANSALVNIPFHFVFSAFNGKLKTTHVLLVHEEAAKLPTSSSTGTAPATPVPTPTSTPIPAPQFQLSSNWSGYSVTGTTSNTSVRGNWTVPILNCSKTPNAVSSVWVGIGGTGSGTGSLLQTGTSDNCVNGVQQDSAFWEEIPPLPSTTFTDFTVQPGDSMSASVTWSGTQWATILQDLNTGLTAFSVIGDTWGVANTATNTVISNEGSNARLSYAGGYTAEWVEEDYTVGNQMPPLADFETVTFSNMTTNITGWSLTTSDAIEMIQGTTPLAIPTDPSTNQYAVTWQS